MPKKLNIPSPRQLRRQQERAARPTCERKHVDKYAVGRPRTCYTSDGKPKIPMSKGRAERKVERMKIDDPKLNCYECTKCGAWHLGHVQ